jgi:beta-lactamase class D
MSVPPCRRRLFRSPVQLRSAWRWRRLPSLLTTVLLLAGGAASAAAAPRVAVTCLPPGAAATFVLLDPQHGRLQVDGGARADRRYSPASTFKLVNTLIGLETGAVDSVDQVLPYGGQPQPRPEWQHDMPLREAIRVSAVPIYQELARRIGLARMAAMLRRLDYGNGEIGTVVDRFWLQGPLAISAVEQVQFLDRLLRQTLPLRPAHVEALEAITLQAESADHALHYKTGWSTATRPQIGWVVGWLRRGDQRQPFALNMDIAGEDALPQRWALARSCLVALGALPAGD